MSVSLVFEDQEPVEVLLSQVTPRAVATLFGIDQHLLYLQDEFGPKAFFPDVTGNHFRFSPDVGDTILSLAVRAPRTVRPSQASGASPLVVSSVPPEASSLETPSWTKPSQRPTFSSKKTTGSVSVKIVKASYLKSSVGGKGEFQKLGQTYVSVSEATANVHYISSVIKQKWGEDYVLVTSDCLELEDSSGTQGLQFWRVGSRKIFAVLSHEVAKGKGTKKRKEATTSKVVKRSYCEIDSDSDDDKYHRDVMKEISSLRLDISQILQLTKGMKLPPGLYIQLKQAFKCKICHTSPIIPPVIYTRCCKNILGCETCVDRWYNGNEGRTRSCPLCRNERSLPETSRLNGLDEFLHNISPLLEDVEQEVSLSTPPSLPPPIPLSLSQLSDEDIQ